MLLGGFHGQCSVELCTDGGSNLPEKARGDSGSGTGSPSARRSSTTSATRAASQCKASSRGSASQDSEVRGRGTFAPQCKRRIGSGLLGKYAGRGCGVIFETIDEAQPVGRFDRRLTARRP